MDHLKSLLFVPAEDRRLAKIGYTDADAYIIDLEDSIASDCKEEALKRTVSFLSRCNETNIFVRINKSRHVEELKELSRFSVGIVLPKFERYEDYADVEDVLMNREVIALVESPKAIINANSIAGISWIDALAFGAEDFTVATGMLNSLDTLLVPKTLLVLSAKANGKKVYDTPCFRLDKEDFILAEATQAFDLGFDGKMAIHPKQIECINKAFSLRDPEYLSYIVKTFDEAGLSVCEIDGRVYEQLHIKRIKEQINNLQ